MMKKKFLVMMCVVLAGLLVMASLGEIATPVFAVEQLHSCGCGCKATANTNTVNWQPVSVPVARYNFAQAGCAGSISLTVKLVFSKDCIQDVFHPPNDASS